MDNPCAGEVDPTRGATPTDTTCVGVPWCAAHLSIVLGGNMERVLYAQNMYRWGGSWVLVLPPDLREALQLVPGDLIIMRRHGPFVTFRRGVPDQIIPISEFHLEDLPPRWPKAGKDAEAGNHPEGKAAAPAKPDAGKDG